MGSITSSRYATQIADRLPSDPPAPLAAAAHESLGAAVQLTAPGSTDIANLAREAFVHSMSRASLVVALVAAFGAVIACRYLPAEPIDTATPTRLPTASVKPRTHE